MINFNIDENSTIEEIEATIAQVEATLALMPEDGVLTPCEIKLHNDLTSYLDDLSWLADDAYHADDQYRGTVLS